MTNFNNNKINSFVKIKLNKNFRDNKLITETMNKIKTFSMNSTKEALLSDKNKIQKKFTQSNDKNKLKTNFVKTELNKILIKNKIKAPTFVRLPKKVLLYKIQSNFKIKTQFKKNSLKLGQLITGKITSVGLNSIGIIQYSDKIKILVSDAELGDLVKIKVFKLYKNIAFAKIIQIIEKEQKKVPISVGNSINVKVLYSNDSVVIAKPFDLENKNESISYYFIIRQEKCKTGDTLQVVVTRLKMNYGFAKSKSILTKSVRSSDDFKDKNSLTPINEKFEYGLKKLNLILPKKATFFGDLALVRIQQPATNLSRLSVAGALTNNTSANQSILLFIKLEMGAQLGDYVRIKVSKVFQTASGLSYAFAKVLKINQPYFFLDKKNKEIKKQKLKETIEQMLKNGMHFGEKAVKSQAKMRNYIWISKKGKSKNRPFIRKGRHYINLLKTHRCLKKVSLALAKYAAKGRTFLFVGTKKPMSSLIYRAALFYKKSFYVNTRWLGGMLTNWKTILKSILKIKPILKEKQKIIQMILTKRQAIKLRLLKKIRTSVKHIQKGKQLLDLIKKNPNLYLTRKQAFSLKRKELIQKGQQLLSKRKVCIEKLKKLFQESQTIKEKGFQIINKYKLTLKLLIIQKQKLRELQNQALLRREIQKMKKNEVLLENSTDDVSKTHNSNANDRWKENIFRTLGYLFRTLGLKNTDYEILIRNMKKGIIESIAVYKNITENIKKLFDFLGQLKNSFKHIQTQMTSLIKLKTLLLTELRKIKTKLIAEQTIIKLLKNKIKRSSAEKKFLKFLPQFKYQPPSTIDAANSVQFLMEKFVDPKIKQAIDSLQIYDEKLKTNSKKIAAARKKKWIQLEKYFGGVANMLKMNKNKISKNVAIIIGQQEEMNAVRECQKLGIQMFHVVDTNCNPTLANHYVPANDNSYKSIKYIFTKLLRHIRLAQKLRLRLWKTPTSSALSRERKKR